MRSLDVAKTQYPASQFHPLLVTEVTRMQHNHYCVAAWDVHAEEMVRPLMLPTHYWEFSERRPMWHPGYLLDALATSTPDGTFPHRRENRVLARRPRLLEMWQESELYTALVGKASHSVQEAFPVKLLENRYVHQGTECPSLGSLQVPRSQLRFAEDDLNHLRLNVTDGAGAAYSLSVTSETLLQRFSPKGGQLGVAEANQWLEKNAPSTSILLRLGFTRGWTGPEGNWSPKRCYLQANGVICPTEIEFPLDAPPESA